MKNPILSEIVILDGVTYKRNNLDIPFSGTYNWVAEDGSDVASFYENGKCVSRHISENGMIKSRTAFKNDEIKEIVVFDENGRIRIRNQMVNGKLEGLTELFSDGILVMATEFKEGKKNGESIVYNSDGSVSYREYFINDVKQ
ncbi:MAG: toxin-antitoxin system YwqK family antitoxin [Sphingobacterium sp.]